jgi:glutamyl-Q tRNA(Asp) synthetase
VLPSVQQPVLRFAPSPNGYLHLGHARSVLFGATRARMLGGRFLLRIEDYDTVRSKPEFVAQVLDDLAWLGVRWEEPVLRQSEHSAIYAAVAAKLTAQGLTYRCFASRDEIARAANGATDPDGAPLNYGLHRDLSARDIAERTACGEPYALRLHMAKAITAARIMTGMVPLTFIELGPDIDPPARGRTEAAHPARWGDIVLIRKDAPASYHLAVVVDDARQGITHVTRGLDLFASTDVHRLLQTLLGLPVPVYQHHSLILDTGGRKLSKSENAKSLKSMKHQGFTASDIRRMAGF